MAYSLKVVDPSTGVQFDTKRENMAGKTEFVEPQGYSPEGKPVQRKQLDLSTGLPIQYTFKYVDEEGNAWEKGEITWKLGEDIVSPIEMTSVFEIKTYRPVDEYVNRFVVDKFYELYADDGASSKKKRSDADKDRTRISNLSGMRKLWDKLIAENMVAGGHFNPASGSFKPGMAFIRAVKVNGCKWGLELGVFKEEKIFSYLQEGVPHAVPSAQRPQMQTKILEASLL